MCAVNRYVPKQINKQKNNTTDKVKSLRQLCKPNIKLCLNIKI